MYAAQHSGIGAVLTEVDALRLTVDYLTCQDNETDTLGGIDLFGINVESWCSSYQSFYQNQDGSYGSYYKLYRGLSHGVDVPLIFSELGCSHGLFDRDNKELKTREGTRDWHQIPVVLNQMESVFSGFSAYAYYGTSQFHMMDGGPWNGQTPLKPTQDFENFVTQLSVAQTQSASISPEEYAKDKHITTDDSLIIHALPMYGGGYLDAYYYQVATTDKTPRCGQVKDLLLKTSNLHLLDMADMPSHFKSISEEEAWGMASIVQTVVSSNLISPLHAQEEKGNMDSPGIAKLFGLLMMVTAMFVFQRSMNRKNSYKPLP
mmetsp:Transcript_310/g.687  ORF Transcript_310/g.687 Transcript_310/m.687 type:complete len:318 (-) Transcript_310:61-1014(-)